MTDQPFDLSKLSPEKRQELVDQAERSVQELNSQQARSIEAALEQEASAEIARQFQALGMNPSQYQRQNIIEKVHRTYQVFGYKKVGK